MTVIKNVTASIKSRLLNRSKQEIRPFNELLQYYAMERFLYRLSRSIHKKDFILKGALMLRVWKSSEFRSTMDIDMLGLSSNQANNLIEQIKEVLFIEVVDDGLSFDIDSLKSEIITEDSDYQGLRLRFNVFLGKAKVVVQLDIGFGDIVHPDVTEEYLPTMLDLPAPKLLCYSRESAIAEKFEAMVKLGSLNSRMKDFYDIWLLSSQFKFKGQDLSKAIQLTFSQRKTKIPELIESFSIEFIELKKVQWLAFRKRLNQEHIPSDFKDIVMQVNNFLSPVVSSIYKDQPFITEWGLLDGWSII